MGPLTDVEVRIGISLLVTLENKLVDSPDALLVTVSIVLTM